MKMASDVEPIPQEQDAPGQGQRRPRYLQHASDHDRFPDLLHPGHREIESHREEQQNNAQFRQHLDVFGRADHSQARWTCDDPRHHESDDRRNAYARQSHDEDDSDRVGQEQRGEEVIVHRSGARR